MGTILPCFFNFAPQGWMLCNGASLSVNDYTALFSLLGTRFGGDGVTTFNLPDLRGAVPIGTGNYTGPEGNASYALGQKGGSFNSVIGQHTHTASTTGGAFSVTGTATLPATTNPATTPTPTNGFIPAAANAVDNSGSGTAPDIYLYAPGANTSLADIPVSQMTGLNVTLLANSGTGSLDGNMQPSIIVNYMMCVVGIYPTQQ